MTPAEFMAACFGVSVAAGLLGALLGLGGGFVIVPALTLLLGVDIRYAIGASLIGVVATSSGAGAAYVREHLTNTRLAMFLELATTLGALLGAWLAGMLSGAALYVAFGCLQFVTAGLMWFRTGGHENDPPLPDPVADRLRLHGTVAGERSEGGRRAYRVVRSRLGFGGSFGAGIISGLLGVGGGLIKVPLMTVGMHVPLKVATATSNFMIGVTAAASAAVYFMRGDVDPFVAGPTALGVLLGAVAGSRLLPRLHSGAIRGLFTAAVLLVAVQMLRRGLA